MSRTGCSENRLVEDLKSLDAARPGFFAAVSHELRSLLTSIEGYVEMLKDEVAGAVNLVQGTMLATVERCAARLRSLIDEVFMLSKLRPEVAVKELTLAVACPGDGLIVAGDAGQLDRVLVNLVSNAVNFTPGGGRIEVTGAAEGGVAVVAVQDSGPRSWCESRWSRPPTAAPTARPAPASRPERARPPGL